jgi:hypothetical protein
MSEQQPNDKPPPLPISQVEAELEQATEELPPLTFWQMAGSALSAAIGVQSSKNRARDFSRGKASHFILIGVGFTLMFVLVMATLVNLILSQVAPN